MKKTLSFGLGLPCVLVMAMGFSCHENPNLKVLKSVDINKGCKVSVDPVTIKTDGQITWAAQDEANSITFPNTNPPNPPPYSPFTNLTAGQAYPIAKGATLTSGPVADDVKDRCSKDDAKPKDCTFKYNVTGATPGCPNDPVVIIHP